MTRLTEIRGEKGPSFLQGKLAIVSTRNQYERRKGGGVLGLRTKNRGQRKGKKRKGKILSSVQKRKSQVPRESR